MAKSSQERSKHGDSSKYLKRQRMDCRSPINVKEEISNEEEEIRRDNISAANKESADTVGHSENKSDSGIPNESKPLLCAACSDLLKIPVYQVCFVFRKSFQHLCVFVKMTLVFENCLYWYEVYYVVSLFRFFN